MTSDDKSETNSTINTSLKKVIGIMGFIDDQINTFAKWICFLCGAGIVICLGLQVTTRYIMHNALIWPEELARFLMIWVAFVGGSVAMKNKALVNFQFILNMFSLRIRKVLNLFINILILVFCIFFLHTGFHALSMYKNFIATGVKISLFWPASGLFVGGAFMLIHVIYDIFELVFSFLEGDAI